MGGVSQDEARGVKEIGCHLEKGQRVAGGPLFAASLDRSLK